MPLNKSLTDRQLSPSSRIQQLEDLQDCIRKDIPCGATKEEVKAALALAREDQSILEKKVAEVKARELTREESKLKSGWIPPVSRR